MLFTLVYVSFLVLMLKKIGAQLQFELSSLHFPVQSVSGPGVGVADGVKTEVEVETLDSDGIGVPAGGDGLFSLGQWLFTPSAGPLQGTTEQQPL